MTMNARKAFIETYQAAITAIAKRGTLRNARHVVSAAERAAGVETGNGVYAASTDTKADFVAYCEDRLAALIANDHAEALEIVLQTQIETDLKAGRPVCEETGADLREWSGIEIEEAHAVALVFNAEVNELAAAVQWDEWANQHDSRKTEAQMIESDHAEALEIEACRNLTARQARFVFHNTAAERARAIEEAHAIALAMDEQYDLASAMAADHEYQMFFSYLRPWAKETFIEVSYAEALALNAVYDRASLRFCEFHLLLSMAEQADQIDSAHLEALVMDAEKEAVA